MKEERTDGRGKTKVDRKEGRKKGREEGKNSRFTIQKIYVKEERKGRKEGKKKGWKEGRKGERKEFKITSSFSRTTGLALIHRRGTSRKKGHGDGGSGSDGW